MKKITSILIVLMLIIPILLFMSSASGAPAYGQIASAVMDTYEWDPQEGSNDGLNGDCRVNSSEYYLLACNGDTGADNDGFLRTMKVWDSNGTIQKSIVDKWEYDITDGAYGNVRHIPGTDKYVVLYKDINAGKSTIITVRVWDNNGSIQKSAIDTQQLAGYGSDDFLLQFNDNVWIAAYQEAASVDGFIETVWINKNGIINNTLLDIEEFDEVKGNAPYVCIVDSNTITITYDGVPDYKLVTYNISSSGIITDTPADSWAYGANSVYTSCINKIGSDKYALTFDSTSLFCKTITISNEGKITKSFIDTLTLTTGTSRNCLETFFVHDPKDTTSGNGVMSVTFRGGAAVGYIYTWNVTTAGVIGDDYDYLAFEASTDTSYAHVEYVSKNWYFIVYTGPGGDGWSCTLEIATNWKPIASNPNPADKSTSVNLQPLCNITVGDAEGHAMSVTFAENSTGSWINRQTNSSVTNGTYRWIYAQASSGSITYHWRVYLNDGYHNVSYDYSFSTTTNNVPNAPSNPLCQGQVNPIRITSLAPTFSWTFSDPNPGDIQGGYNIRVGTTANSGNLWNTTVISSLQSVVYAGSALLRGVTYHWSVRTNDTHTSNMGSYCGDQTFEINALPVAIPAAPSNNTEGVNLYASVSWTFTDSDSPSQVAYDLLIDDDGLFGSPTVHINTTSSANQYNCTSPLKKDTIYYWKIKVKDETQWGTYGETWKFTTTNLTVKDITTYNSNYQKTSLFNVNQKVVIQYNVTGIIDMNNTYITITDPLGMKWVDHQGVSSANENFTTDTNWNEDYANRWNAATDYYVSSPKSYQHGLNGGSGQYGAYTLLKSSVLANQTDATVQVSIYIDYSSEDMQRLFLRWKDTNNYVCAYMSTIYSVIGIEEKINGVRYFTETSHLFSQDTWYTMKFSLYGDTASVYINNVWMLTRTHVVTTGSGRLGIGCDTGWIYFDDYSVGYPNSRVIKAIPDGYQYEFNYTTPANASLAGTWTIAASAEQLGQISTNTSTFNIYSTYPLINDVQTYNSTYIQQASFYNGNKVVIRALVTDYYGRPGITNCNITIKNPLGTIKVNHIEMTHISNITGGYLYEYNYTIPQETTSAGTWNITISVKNNRSGTATSYQHFFDSIGAPAVTIKTYDAFSTEKTLFAVNDPMKIEATVTDVDGRADIVSCNVTIYAPNGTRMKNNITMSIIGNVTDCRIFNYNYNLPGSIGFGTWVVTIRTKDNYYTTIGTSHFVLQWADTKYYHREKITLLEQFNLDRTHELLGFSITLPTTVCGGNNTIKIVNEKGEVMPFSILKKSGTIYYIGFVANISASDTLDYYIYYNVTGTTPPMYTTFANAAYNNLTLSVSNYTQVYDSATQNITQGKAINLFDINGDGKKEIIWVGRTGPDLHNKGFLGIYNTTWISADSCQIHQLAYTEWNTSGGTGEAFAYSVNVSDVDNDGTSEIITGGTYYDGTKNKAQLRIWNFTGGSIHLEKEATWYDTHAGDTVIYGVVCKDADGDGNKEILTAGTTGTDNARGQFAVHRYLSGQITTQYFNNYSVRPTAGKNWTEFNCIVVGDIYTTGGTAVAVGGEGFDAGGTINAVFNIYSYYSGAWHLDWTKNWYDGQLSEIFSISIGKVSNDNINKLVVSGNYFDSIRDIAFYRVFHVSGSGYPATLTEDTGAYQSWYISGYSSALSNIVEDINKDGLIDITTVGFQNNGAIDSGDYKIRRYNGTATLLECSEIWTSQYARRSGDFGDAARIADLNNDGFNELVDTGRYALTPPAGTYLRVQTVSGIGQTLGSQDAMPPNAPSSVTKVSKTATSISLSWTKGINANNTVIVYKKGSYPTSVTDGTIGYNNTGTSANISSLGIGTIYYFAFYSWGPGAYSVEQTQINDFTYPTNPTNFVVNNPTYNSIDLSWTGGTNTTNTVIVRKIGTYPTSRTDGTVIYNNTGTSTTNGNLNSTTTYYYSAWSWKMADGYSLDYVSGNATTLAPHPPTAPDPTKVYPINGSTDVIKRPKVRIWANDTGGGLLTVDFYYSLDGTNFTFAQQNISVPANTTVIWKFAQASNFTTLYYWQVSINDEIWTTTATYHFTTQEFNATQMSISLNRTSWYPTAGIGDHELTSDTWAMVENNGSISVNVEINAINSTNWSLKSTAGHNQFNLSYLKSGTSIWDNILTAKQMFAMDLTPDEYIDFGMQLFMPTSTSTENNQSTILTLTVTPS